MIRTSLEVRIHRILTVPGSEKVKCMAYAVANWLSATIPVLSIIFENASCVLCPLIFGIKKE